MFKLCVLLAVLSVAAAGVIPAAPIVTAASSQVIARNYNTLAYAAPAYAAAPIAAAPLTAPIAASPFAYTAPLAYSTHAVAPAAYPAYAAAAPLAVY
ncbi:cuticle protein 38 [Athalia rosae]|uniref:cuticle protein 38 n=1 Tax=Athalia rosae TaxID=37344 RepID=UPI002033606B|nr:cuticle protein 38 [Athalia rosae]